MILGVVLAGGRSSRFGSDKALAELGGKPLLAHAVERLGAWCDDVVVAGRETAAARGIADWPRPDMGPLGGIATTPVINRPEVAIIGPNKVVERPVFRDGQVAAAKLMNLSISCDHRVVDGWDAASFVQALKRLIETPAPLFVD